MCEQADFGETVADSPRDPFWRRHNRRSASPTSGGVEGVSRVLKGKFTNIVCA
jgi:hypothetical protein